MSDDIRFERNAREWLEIGPTQAPARAVEAALATVDTTPQQRDLRAPWRFPSLKLSPRLATAAVVAIVVVAAGFLLLRNQPATVGGPSPSRTTSPSPSASLTVSAALQTTWVSVGTRPWPGVLDQPSTFEFGPSALRIWQPHVDVDSAWSLTDNDSLLRVDLQGGPLPVLKSQRWNCLIGQIGVYSFAFSGGTEALALQPVNDPCTARASILAGDWSRTPCHNWEREVCLGPLSQGTHVAPYFKPFDGGAQGQLAYTLPAGWAEMYVPPASTQNEVPTQMSLWRESAHREAAIVLYANVAPSSVLIVPDSSPIRCGQAVNSNARTTAQIVAWLASRPYLSVTPPTPVSIGGLNGVFVDVSAMPGWVDPCWVNDQEISIFASQHDQSTVYLDTSGNARARYILLDRGGGQSLLIVVETHDAADFDALLGDALLVIDSFEFRH